MDKLESTEYDFIETQIISALDSFLEKEVDYALEKFKGKNAPWTKRIMAILTDLGESHDYEVYASGHYDNTVTAWLYDLVWSEVQNGDLTSIPLVVESEWPRGLRDIKTDFEKLLVTNAEHRLMICQASSSRKLSELKSFFCRSINSYRLGRSGDRFLVAIYDDCDTGEFIYQLYIK
ncbi:MAG: hypothetical protein RL204_1594 [Bacteroidota bacterium]|jgi:hypothetical protein